MFELLSASGDGLGAMLVNHALEETGEAESSIDDIYASTAKMMLVKDLAVDQEDIASL